MDLEAVSEVDTSVTSDFAEAATNNLLPEKSRNLYEKEYTKFCNWRSQNKAKGVSEDIILAYLSEKARKPSSLWRYDSMLKVVITLKEKNWSNFLRS